MCQANHYIGHRLYRRDSTDSQSLAYYCNREMGILKQTVVLNYIIPSVNMLLVRLKIKQLRCNNIARSLKSFRSNPAPSDLLQILAWNSTKNIFLRTGIITCLIFFHHVVCRQYTVLWFDNNIFIYRIIMMNLYCEDKN